MKNIVKYIVAFAVIALALGYFVITGLSGEKLYYKEVSELINKPDEYNGKGLKVSGNVTHDNFTVNKFQQYASFMITDPAGAVMSVEYRGVIPDAFEQGAAVVVEGTYNKDENLFTARRMMAKCPSKYEAAGEEHPDDIQKQADEAVKQS